MSRTPSTAPSAAESSQVAEQLEKVLLQLTHMQIAVDRRFVEVLNDVDNKFTYIGDQVSEVQRKVMEIDRRVDVIEVNLGKRLEERIAQFEASIKQDATRGGGHPLSPTKRHRPGSSPPSPSSYAAAAAADPRGSSEPPRRAQRDPSTTRAAQAGPGSVADASALWLGGFPCPLSKPALEHHFKQQVAGHAGAAPNKVFAVVRYLSRAYSIRCDSRGTADHLIDYARQNPLKYTDAQGEVHELRLCTDGAPRARIAARGLHQLWQATTEALRPGGALAQEGVRLFSDSTRAELWLQSDDMGIVLVSGMQDAQGVFSFSLDPGAAEKYPALAAVAPAACEAANEATRPRL